jgi:hypothetical protein
LALPERQLFGGSFATAEFAHDPVHGIADPDKVFVRDPIAGGDLGSHLPDTQSSLSGQVDQRLIRWRRLGIAEKFVPKLRPQAAQCSAARWRFLLFVGHRNLIGQKMSSVAKNGRLHSVAVFGPIWPRRPHHASPIASASAMTAQPHAKPATNAAAIMRASDRVQCRAKLARD